MSEDWLPIPGHPTYEVSSAGQVRNSRGTILKPRDVRGYGQVALYSSGDGRRVVELVHRLVLLAFVGPCPEGMEARHLNGKRRDNWLENLCWGTPRENTMDQIKHGTHHTASVTHCPYGHPYDEQNTYRHGGRRHCRACGKRRDLESKRRKKERGTGHGPD